MRPGTTTRTATRGAWFQRLDGEWRFRLVDRPEDVPIDVGDVGHPDGDGDGWRGVAVPGLWTMQGTTTVRHYTNVQMPFTAAPPAVPEANPTGCYRTPFTVPTTWGGRRVVLHVGAAESALARPRQRSARRHQQGQPPRCRVRHHRRPDRRRRRQRADVRRRQVVRRHLHRGPGPVVARWAPPRGVPAGQRSLIHIADVKAIGGLADDLDDGHAGAPRRGGGRRRGPGRRGRVVGGRSRRDPRRRTGADLGSARRARSVEPPDPSGSPARSCAATVTSAASIRGRPSDPTRYRARHRASRPGRRRRGGGDRARSGSVESRSRRGSCGSTARPVLIRGVNRHDFHPDTGRVVSAEDLRADVVLMKRFGFNAVRTSHYPNDPRVPRPVRRVRALRHRRGRTSRATPRSSRCATTPATGRLRRPGGADGAAGQEPSRAIIVWSLGNESGHGANQEAEAAWIRALRPVATAALRRRR